MQRLCGLVVAVLSCVVSGGAAVTAQAQQHDSAAGHEASWTATDEDSPLDNWWLGAYFRHLWVPSYVTSPFFERAPSVVNNGFGLEATYHSDGGFNVVMGIGYMPYEFSGAFLEDGEPLTDTELVRSDVDFLHLTSSFLWDLEFHETFALEFGFGIDLGTFIGEVRRNEAYVEDGRFRDCEGPGMPAVVHDDVPFCNSEEEGGTVTDSPGEPGEHYDVEEDRVPPVMLFPMVPHLALRARPVQELAIKLEFGFGIVQMWAGVSLHGNLGLFETESGPEPEPAVDVSPDATGTEGRVLGRVLDATSGDPIEGARVEVKARALSPLTTTKDGNFVVDRLPSGPVAFEIEHPDYENERCDTEIPAGGGDVYVHCRLAPTPRRGAIHGEIRAPGDVPVATDQIELKGPIDQKLSSDDKGEFAVEDIPEGTYRIRVDADGYLSQVTQVEVGVQETAMPRIVLVEKPKHARVQLRQKEIVISQQVQFKLGSAEIQESSESLLSEVADLLLRNQRIELVEIQGHTDNRGPRELNQTLSQRRAEAVRQWLIDAGVTPERLQAKGYGPDHPIRPNNTAINRAKNRRVQFIIRSRTQ